MAKTSTNFKYKGAEIDLKSGRIVEVLKDSAMEYDLSTELERWAKLGRVDISISYSTDIPSLEDENLPSDEEDGSQ